MRELTAEYPLAEPLAAALMRALHATDRSADALAHYATIRQRLVDELGADPSIELQAVHQAILHGDLDTPPPQIIAQPVTVAVTPSQLPAAVAGFAGRVDQLTQLDTLLASTTAQPAVMAVCAVSGTAGVGKTALVVHWAHRVADRFPDGQLYVNLRGFDRSDQPMPAAQAVRGFLDALGVTPQRIPAELDAQAGLYRSLLAGKRILVVLDNARDDDHVRPLLPGTPTAFVAVTSRNQLTPLVAANGAHPLTLDVMSPTDARDLLAYRLGADRVAAEADAAEQIITWSARLPLALAIAAARARQTDFALTTLAAELTEADRRLDALDAGDLTTQVRTVLSWSYTALTSPAARLLRLLGLHPGPDISTAAAASLAGRSFGETIPLLTELARANLITEHMPGRYTLHDLLRAYVTDLARMHDTDTHRHAAVGRLLDHYLHTAYTADRVLTPTRDPITLKPPHPGATPELPTDHRQALYWFSTEYLVLLAAVDYAATTGFDTHVWQLAWTLQTFLYRRGHWHDQVTTGRTAVAAAGRLADPAAKAVAHLMVAGANIMLRHYDDARTQLTHALDLYRLAGDQTGQAQTHRVLGSLWERWGQPVQALDHAQQALDLFRATGHRIGQAIGLNNIGWCHALLGDYRQALTACQQALILHQELDDSSMQAETWDSLGYAHHHLGHHTEAITCYHRAIELYRDLGARYMEADTFTHLGDTHDAAGNTAAAHDAWQHALNILTELDHPDAGQLRTKLHQHSHQAASTPHTCDGTLNTGLS